MFEPAVDRLGGAVAGAGPVEVGQHVGGALLQGPAERDELGQRGGDAVADASRSAAASARGPWRGRVRGRRRSSAGRCPRSPRPRRARRRRTAPSSRSRLLVGEQVGAGVQGPPGRGRAGRRCGRGGRGWSCWTRRRHRSRASPARRTTWKGSITATASGSSSVVAVLNPVNPSIATTSTPSRQACGRSASQVLNACLERPSTMSSSRAGPVPSRIGVRSMITVTYLSPRRVCRQHVLVDADRRSTPSNRCGSSIRTRLPSARTASLAVFHDTPRPSATRATVRCWHHDAFQRPPQPAARQLRPRLGRRGWCPGATRARSRCTGSGGP